MKYFPTKIKGVFILEPRIFKDDRGYFFESFSKRELEKYIGNVEFVQDNESASIKGALRGLHFQKPPYSNSLKNLYPYYIINLTKNKAFKS